MSAQWNPERCEFLSSLTRMTISRTILEALADDVDEIWHLGDVCAARLLVRLESIGPPVTLVRGNCDANFEWPPVVDLERNGVRFRLVHVPPDAPPENIDVLLHGHTHVPRHERQEDVLYS